MPVQFLSVAERDRLARFPNPIVRTDLAAYFTLSTDDRELIAQLRGDHNRLGFALQLAALRLLGFVPADLSTAPEVAVRYLAEQLDLHSGALARYGTRPKTLREHVTLAVAHLGFRRVTPFDLELLEHWLIERALEHDRPTVLLEAACSKLKRERLVRPGLTVLERIEDGWDDLVRVAASLKLGYVTASLLISKLQVRPRQNRLTRLLQEYGRLVKTVHVLRCLESEAYRRRIGAQLNKGERLHQLRAWLTFGGDGKLRRKHEEAQTEQARCLNLVTNAVVVWNTRYIQAIVEALQTEGHPVEDETLMHLSPTRFEHINRYGKYHFDVEAAARTALRPLRKP